MSIILQGITALLVLVVTVLIAVGWSVLMTRDAISEVRATGNKSRYDPQQRSKFDVWIQCTLAAGSWTAAIALILYVASSFTR